MKKQLTSWRVGQMLWSFLRFVIIFGLANDAIGYIIPDNDYAMALAFGHYHETLSLGEKTALTLTQAYENIIK